MQKLTLFELFFLASFAMDGYNFFNYVPTSDKEEENHVVPSFFHNVVAKIQNFDTEQEEN